MSLNQKTITTGLLFVSPTLLSEAEQRPALIRHINACLERHRAGDDGLVTEIVRLQNRAACDAHGIVVSAYLCDPAKPLGEDGGNLLWIKTLPGWEETFIMQPGDLDREDELIMCQEFAD